MLPPGHIAAGYLTAEVLLHDYPSTIISLSQQNQLLWWGMFFGFAPDLDYFYVLYRQRAFTVKDGGQVNHRKFLTHAPILWLIAGLAIYFLSTDVYYQILGLLLWLASWSHFILDSVEDGVMWLWPISSKQFALKHPANIIIDDDSFFSHWWKFIKQYASTRVSFYLEVLIILTALTIALNNNLK